MKHISFTLLLGVLSLLAQGATQEVINLGDTPWKFTKVIKNESNVALGLNAVMGKHVTRDILDGRKDTYLTVDVNKGEYITVDLLKKQPINDITLSFGGDSVNYISSSIEVSNDNATWKVLNDPKSIAKLQPVKSNDITNVNNTVGFTMVTTHTALSVDVKDSYQYVRVKISNCKNAKQQPIACKLEELEIHPITENKPDAFYLDANLDLSTWVTVGIPHCYNEHDTFLNTSTGERCWRGESWYRKNLFVPNSDKGKKLFLEFISVNIGAAVYINGHPIETNSCVKQPSPVTHVGSSLPFVVDITPYVEYGKENIIAVKVSNSKNTFFTWPQFAENEGFGQAMGGIVASVYLHKKSPVHIPFNSYSPLNKWGTYFATIKASPEKAELHFQTNVENESEIVQKVELRTRLIDNKGKSILEFKQFAQLQPGSTHLFDATKMLENPHLWYPIGMEGEPYLYTIENSVFINGKCSDTHKEKFGIRTITWDKDYCYVNGKKCELRGFGDRNIYPGLGAALPVSFQWNEVKLIADCGGNTLRIGHQPPFTETFNACDEYGVMLIVNSGDNEWALHNEPANSYKREYDRDLIIAMRNHPCVAVWESNNGLAYDGEKYYPSYTQEQVEKWDYLAPRIVSNRDGYPPEWDPKNNIVISYTNHYDKDPNHPSLNAEVYGTNWSGNPSWCISRDDYEHEKAFAGFYVQNYFDDLNRKACGWIEWMLAETYGEGYTIYLNGKRNQKSLGSCAMDQNRFPKLNYRIFKNSVWIPYEKQPGVTLQSHWNLSGIQTVDAWSNCPYVDLQINGISKGIITPEKPTGHCAWKDIEWEAGEVKAIGLDENRNPVCNDRIHSAEDPYALQVNVEPLMTKPNGQQFELTANASDAFIATVKVVDKNGNWCPFANNTLHFEVEGEGVYKGSYNFYVADGKPLDYHAPGDPELQAEGGMMRVAVRTTFTPGKIKVKVTSPGLISGEDVVTSKPIKSNKLKTR